MADREPTSILLVIARDEAVVECKLFTRYSLRPEPGRPGRPRLLVRGPRKITPQTLAAAPAQPKAAVEHLGAIWTTGGVPRNLAARRRAHASTRSRSGGWTSRLSLPESLDLLDLADRARGCSGCRHPGVAFFLSDHRQAISGRVVFWGLVLQWGFALLVLRVPAGVDLVGRAGEGVEAMLDCAWPAPSSSSARRWWTARGPRDSCSRFGSCRR